MDQFTQQSPYPDPDQVPVMPLALRFGLIGGLALIVTNLVLHFAGIMDYSTQMNSGAAISTAATLGILIYSITSAIRIHRDEELGGIITFGRCVKVGVLTSAAIGLLVGLFTYFLFTVIDPSIMETIKEMTYESMDEQGLSEEEIEAAEGMMGFFLGPIWFTFVTIVAHIFYGLIISLISGAILKKEV